MGVQVGRGRTGAVLDAEQQRWDAASGASDRVPGNTGRITLLDAVQCGALAAAIVVVAAVACVCAPGAVTRRAAYVGSRPHVKGEVGMQCNRPMAARAIVAVKSGGACHARLGQFIIILSTPP